MEGHQSDDPSIYEATPEDSVVTMVISTKILRRCPLATHFWSFAHRPSEGYRYQKYVPLESK